MSEADADTERVAVTARVPAYQKEAWVADADRLDMSQSEFLRTMVQAGRRDLGIAEEFGPPNGADDATDAEPKESATNTGDPESASPGMDPGGSGLEDRLLAALDREGVMSFDELVETVADDVEQRVDETMGEMMSNERVTYSGRDDGYTLVER